MRGTGLVVSAAIAIWCTSLAAQSAKKGAPAPGEPTVLSIHPFTAQRGTSFQAVARGNSIRGASSIFIPQAAPFTVTVVSANAEPVPPAAPGAKPKTPADLVTLRIEVKPDAKPGRYPVRLVTPAGVSNALPVFITEYPVSPESEPAHETPDTAQPLPAAPAIITGKIGQRGESDFYQLEAKAGETYTFEVLSGLPSTGAPGGNANGFDPSISIYEFTGSWFNAKDLKRIAFNDEPLWVIGKATEAYLPFTFKKAGKYLVRVEAFSGQGGPDYSYHLKVLKGSVPQDVAPEPDTWEERNFPRRLSANRLNELAQRGGKAQDKPSIETYRAAAVPPAEAPMVKLPASLDGALDAPGVTHRARFRLDGPMDLAIEVETPQIGPPQFNPIVRLLNDAGQEVATNIFAGRGACTGALNKALTAKAVLPVRNAGEYTVEIRDTTSDIADPGFKYRVQLRPQVPHIGQVRIDADHINLKPGAAQTVRVVFDREEDYRGAVLVMPEGLPAGVQAVAGADFEPDKDPPMYPGKRERYVPRTERSVVVFTAAPDAAPTQGPIVARLVVRPVTDGKPGAELAAKQIPIMVTAKP